MDSFWFIGIEKEKINGKMRNLYKIGSLNLKWSIFLMPRKDQNKTKKRVRWVFQNLDEEGSRTEKKDHICCAHESAIIGKAWIFQTGF